MVRKTKSRADQIEEWMNRDWKMSTGGSDAPYLNTRGYHVAVWEDYEHARRVDVAIQTRRGGRGEEFSSRRYPDEPKAKRAVLEKTREKLGLM